MPYLKLLGGAVLEDETGPITGPVARRHPLAVLALLATAPSRTLSRSKLVGFLWPDTPEETGRKRLNTYLVHIRGELGEGALVSAGDDVRLDEDGLSCDVWRFEEALEAGEPERAVELYGGPFLDGFQSGGSPAFEHRVDVERARLRARYREALEALAQAAEARGEPEVAARWWRERVNDDPYDSRVVLRLMEALAAAGNLMAALEVARIHEQLLQAEFGTELSSEVVQLAERLRAGEAGGGERSSAEGSLAEPPVAAPLAQPPDTEPAFAEPAAAEPAASQARRRLPGERTLLASLVALGLVGAAVTGVWYLVGATGSDGGAAGAGAEAGTLAVLPFRPLGEEPDAFSEGFHSDLLTRLSTVVGLEVISRASAATLAEAGGSLSEAARALGVRWVMEADVQRAGDEVRLNARLVDARRDRQVWAATYERPLTAGNLFELQSEVAQAIVRALELEVTPEDERRLRAVPTRHLGAYELYLVAQELDRRRTGPPSSERKVELYRRALALDPNFADAWAGLADAFVERGWGTADPAWLDSATAAAERALALDPDLADAHAQMADVAWTRGQPDEAIATYRRALELDPSHWEARNNLLVLLERRGLLTETARWLDRARRLSPADSVPIAALAWLNAELGRDELVDAWLAYGRERGNRMAWADLHISLFHRGDVERARELLDEVAHLEDDDNLQILRRRAALALYEEDWDGARQHYRALYPGVQRASLFLFRSLLWDPLCLAFVLERLGDPEQAREIAREDLRAGAAVAEADPDHVPRHRLAVAHLLAGDTAAALAWLERAAETGYLGARLLRTIPTLEPLRGHPGFEDLLGRLEARVAEERRRIEAEGLAEPPGWRSGTGG